MPSRRDSQYAISLRQWRFAEMCELGLATREDPVLVSALSRLYANDIPRADTGRARSSAEAERNMPPTALTRADLGWRSLLFGRAQLPPLTAAPLPSVLLEAQGFGVLRRDAGRVYVALDYGHSGGGHGHPDRLNLLFMRGQTRWLDDFGTGSYVDPSLHWYRSTLAHNAPFVDGQSQPRVSGALIAYDEHLDAGVISAAARIGAKATAIRTIIVMADYFVDELTFSDSQSLFMDLPLHVDVAPVGVTTPPRAAALAGRDGLEDGFRFIRDAVKIAAVSAKEVIHLRGTRNAETLDIWMSGYEPFDIWRATAPGAPGHGDASFIIVRSQAPRSAVMSVWSWTGAVTSVAFHPALVVTTKDGRHEFGYGDGLNVTIVAGDTRRTVALAIGEPGGPTGSGSLLEPTEAAGDEPRHAVVLKPEHPVRVMLGGESYRRSEETWEDAGSPTAEIVFENENGELVIEAAATNVDRTFAAPGGVNRLDNEQADVNGAGIQLYLRTDEASAGYVLVPNLVDATVNARPIGGWGSEIPVEATWTAIDNGYVVEIHVLGVSSGTVIDVDLIVNEKPTGRERRRGQLVLSGGSGEFVYLRGDRHDPDRLIPMLLTDV
jgi:hypothetical protein